MHLYGKKDSYQTIADASVQKLHFSSLFFPGPPRADVASIQEKLHLGQNLKLTCPIQGDPTPLFEWFKVSHTHHGSLFCLLLGILTENRPIFHFICRYLLPVGKKIVIVRFRNEMNSSNLFQ